MPEVYHVAGISRTALLLGTCAMLIATAARAAGDHGELLRREVELLPYGPTTKVADRPIAAPTLLLELYSRREFTLAWSDRARVEELLGYIANIGNQGLDPADYHHRALRRLVQERFDLPVDDPRRIDLDLLLTDALVRVLYHLRFGKVNPADLDPTWNYNRSLAGVDPVAAVQAAIDAPSLAAFVAERLPRGDAYHDMQRALARYRDIADAGGWPAIPAGPALKPGMHDERVRALEARLLAVGDLETRHAAAGDLYDEALVTAVRRFQRRHGLEDDGVVGRATLAAMNVPARARVDQLRANLERARWVFDDLEDDFLLVNIAGFRAYLVHDGERLWQSRVQVGRPYRKTPVFKTKMTYLVFNPTWTVPPTILRNDVLPKLRADAAYLREQRMDVVDAQGRIVDPTSVDWATVKAGDFPYRLRQRPGDHNALGRVKFIFPNPYAVFLHDTPSKELFEPAQRTFSSGCIRLQYPFELAGLLLADQPAWDQQAIEAAVASGQIRTVPLSEPLTVMLLYWTAEVDEDGTVRFFPDVYDRDRALIEALDSEVRLVPPPGLPEALRRE